MTPIATFHKLLEKYQGVLAADHLEIKNIKDLVVKSQNFEEASKIREVEKGMHHLLQAIEEAIKR